MKQKIYLTAAVCLLCLSQAQARTDYNIDTGSVTISTGGEYRIFGDGSPTTNTIKVNSGVVADITLENVNINVSNTANACAFDMLGATVTLRLSGENTLKSGANAAGLHTPQGATLTITSISGDGSTEGTLSAGGGAGAAGIGGSGSEGGGDNGGAITILGGTITATGGTGTIGGAGIGGGDFGSGGVIAISGGMVTATGGIGGAGIGGGGINSEGWGNSGGVITISGGVVTAGGGIGSAGGAGIGGGYGDSGGTISITGGTVTANGGACAAGIGGGEGGDGGVIAISGGTVIANTTRYAAAAIGGGMMGNGGTITISGGTITAFSPGGTWDPATIGGGGNGNAGTITISGGAVMAINTTGPGIGGGAGYTGGSISISGGTLIVTGNGIGIGTNGGSTPTTITGAPVIFATAINGTPSTPKNGIVTGNDVTITPSRYPPDSVRITLHISLVVPLQALFTIPAKWTFDYGVYSLTINGTMLNYGTITPFCDIYTVSFDMNDNGTQIDPITNIVDKSRLLAVKPKDPTEGGYFFGGWYKDNLCTNPWNFSSDRITGNTTLYAKWTTGPVIGVNSNDMSPEYEPEPSIEIMPNGQIICDPGFEGWYYIHDRFVDVSDVENACAVYIPQGAHLELIYSGNVGFKSNGSSPGIYVAEGASLTIYVNTAYPPEVVSTSTLSVWGGLGTGKHSGAGIGGGEAQNCGTVIFGERYYDYNRNGYTIRRPGGTVNAYGFNDGNTNYSNGGAGIGGGGFDPSSASSKAGNGGTVIVYSGTINAVGGGSASLLGEGAAGIGSGSGNYRIMGSGGSGGSLILYHGMDSIGGVLVESANGDITVNATGGWNGAGVGGGFYGSGGDVTVMSGTLNATGGFGAAGIGGGGYNNNGGTVAILGGTVTATGGKGGSGIGGGGQDVIGGSSDIAISGGAVIATGGDNAAGIGGGYYGDGSTVAISGGTVIATGIGGGDGGSGGSISIEGAPVIFATNGISSAPENGIATGDDAGINPAAKSVTLHTDFIIPEDAILTVPAVWTLNHTNHSLTNNGTIINNGSIVPPLVTGVSLNKNEVELYYSYHDTLTATVSPADAADSVTWKSIGDTVVLTPLGDTSCRLTGASIGTDTVWVRTMDGGKTDFCIVTVSKAPQSITGFFPADTAILLGAHINFPAVGSSGLPITYTSSNPNTATVNGKLITAVGLGTTVITASLEGNHNYNPAPTLTCMLTVVSVLVTDVSLNKNAVSLPVGDSDTLIATVSPIDATNRSITWESTDNITIETLNDTSCVITRNSAGTAVVRVRTVEGGKTDSCFVTENPVPVSEVSLNKATFNLYVGDSDTLTVTVSPIDATNRSITLEHDDAVTISRFSNTRYIITGVSAGTDTVWVRTVDGDRMAFCEVTVSKVPQSITGFFPADTAILLGDHINLSAISSSGLPVAYTHSNTDVAIIEDNLITAVGLGSTVITAYQEGNHYYDFAPALTCTLTVNPVPVAGVSLNEHTLELRMGDSDTLIATVSPDNATNRRIDWVHTGDAADSELLNDTCVITGVSVGTDTVWVRTADGGKMDSCKVTVLKKIQNITNHVHLTKTYGDSPFPLQAQVASGLPVSYTIANPPGNTVAELSNDSVTICNAGHALIFAHQDGDSDNEAAMIVSAMLTVDTATLIIAPKVGQHKTYGEADPVLTCESFGWKYGDNESILTGSLSRAEGEDAGVYNFTPGDLSAGDNYNIGFASDVKFTIDKADQSIAGFLPADTSVDHRTQMNLSATGGDSGNPVTYTSSNPAVAIIEGNLITAVGVGRTVITAGQAGNHNYNPAALPCTMTVNPVPINKVTLDRTGCYLPKNSTVQLTATVLPDNATNPAVIWSSDNESVATVDDGRVYAVGEGFARITAVSAYDYSKEVFCMVVVTAAVPTGISTVGESSSAAVFFRDGTLYTDSPAAERIEVYTLSGELLHRASKQAGWDSFTIPNPERLLIVRGSSGWVKKIEDR